MKFRIGELIYLPRLGEAQVQEAHSDGTYTVVTTEVYSNNNTFRVRPTQVSSWEILPKSLYDATR